MNAITRTRGLAGLALLGSAGLVLAGCAAAPEEDNGGSAPEDGGDFLACAVSDEGSWQDQSFNQAAYEGLELAQEELGVEIADAESDSAEDFGPNLQQMVDQNCDVTFAVGFNFGPEGSIFEIADANTEARFVWIDGWNQGQSNLKPITYAMEQSSYLAGYLAAAYSTTKTVGTYGGMQIDAVTAFMDGFYYGAKAWGEENGQEVTVVGWNPEAATGDFTGDFTDTAAAESISQRQLTEGVDVFFPVAGGLFGSTIEVIDSQGADAVVIGVDKDIALTQPQYAPYILTSVEKRMTQAVYDVVESLQGGDEFSVDPYVGTLENDGTALSDFYEFEAEIPEEVTTRLAELTEEIVAGEIEIPLTTNPTE